MRPRFGAVLGLTLAAGLAVAGFARAEDAQTCEVPAYLLTTDSTLPKVADAVKNARPLNVLVVGSRSSTILSSEASAYPAKLQAALKERLPSIPVTLSVELQTGKTAEDSGEKQGQGKKKGKGAPAAETNDDDSGEDDES